MIEDGSWSLGSDPGWTSFYLSANEALMDLLVFARANRGKPGSTIEIIL